MSHPSPSGERPSLPSSQEAHQSVSLNRSAPSTFSPRLVNTPQGGLHESYQPLAPAGPVDRAGRQYDIPQIPPESGAQTPSRSLGVHSILNPPSESAQSGPRSTQSSRQVVLPPLSTSPRGRKRSEPNEPQQEQATLSAAPARRVLTPRSPANRATSIGVKRLPTYHTTGLSLQPHPATESRIYTAEPGSADVPALPPLAAASRAPLPMMPAHDFSFSGRVQHPIPGHAPGGASGATTQSDSPSTSHTSHSQPEQTSPAYRYGSAPSAQPSHPGFRIAASGADLQPQGRGPAESFQAGPSGYQMTLETNEGPMVVPVEVDTQHASKTADEKRKRNAGASARFRARRKEKEKESSQTIANLQQETREYRQVIDFYRAERNYWRDFAARQVGTEQLPPRPPSPLPPPAASRSTPAGELSHTVEESGRARSDSAPATQRQRTEDYQPTLASTLQNPPAPPFISAYGSQQGLPLPPPGQATGTFASPRSLPPAPLGPRSQSSYDPFRRDPFDRNWGSGR